jgi:hypothetical protein
MCVDSSPRPNADLVVNQNGKTYSLCNEVMSTLSNKWIMRIQEIFAFGV